MKLNVEQAAAILAELGNSTRLRIVRLLVDAGVDGLTVGEIQRRLNVPASTLSHHIAHLRKTGLLDQTRCSTTLYCCVSFVTIDAVVRFLTDQCCSGAAPLKADKRAPT